jgi:hypothetical protein
MLVLAAFKVHVKPEIQVIIAGSSMYTDHMVVLEGDNLMTAGEQTIQRPAETAV